MLEILTSLMDQFCQLTNVKAKYKLETIFTRVIYDINKKLAMMRYRRKVSLNGLTAECCTFE